MPSCRGRCRGPRRRFGCCSSQPLHLLYTSYASFTALQSRLITAEGENKGWCLVVRLVPSSWIRDSICCKPREESAQLTSLPARRGGVQHSASASESVAMLPLEVEFLIIEQLQDKQSLSACSCVCRSWLQFSRSCLFGDLIIHLPRNDSERPEALVRFLARSSRSPYPLGNYVKRLALRGEDARLPVAASYSLGDCCPRASKDLELAQLANHDVLVDMDSDEVPEDCANLPVRSLRAILSLCPQLKVLDLERLLLYDAPASPQYSSLLAAFQPHPLHGLLIEDCSSTTRDMRYFFDVITMFSSIDRLFVDCGPWELPVGGPKYELPPPSPIIHDLTLQALEDPNCASAFYESLRRSGSLDGPLKVIQFMGYSREEVLEFFDFLKDAGKHLTELNIDMCVPLRDSHGTPESWDGLSLDCCPTLEKLTLVFDFHSPDEMSWTRDVVIHAALRVYTRLLLSGHGPSGPGSPPPLRELSFCVYGAANARLAFTRSAALSDEGRELWGALDHALVGLPALASVKFLLCDVDGEEDLAGCKAGLWAFVGDWLPMAGGRGLVCLRSEREEYPD